MSYERILLLDVDGVLNPETKWATRLDKTFKQHGIGGYWVWVSPYQGKWLRGLIEDRDVTLVWATTWVSSAPMLAELAKLLGLPTDLPRIDGIDHDDIHFNSGKKAGVERWLEEHGVNPYRTPCVWVDDLLGDEDRRWAWTHGIYPVHVDERIGIADKRVISSIEAGLGLTILQDVS